MANIKPLHVASSLEELNKKVDTKLFDGATPKGLCRMADKLLLKAKDESLSGDEEQAYILYMRFVDLVKAVMASKEYRKDKKELDKYLPPRKIKEALTLAEALSASLKDRYAELNQIIGEADQVVPDNQPIKEQEIVSMVTPAHNSEVTPSTPPPLTPTQLYTLLASTPSQVLVLDCRTRASFVSSHPDSKKFPQWLSVPEETVIKGLTEQSVNAFLKSSGKDLWKKRHKMNHVVMVDECSTSEDIGIPLLALRDALTKWEDTDPLAPPNPYLLEGGYNMWYLSYQVTCIGRYKSPQRSEVKVTKSEETNALAYPTFEDPSELTPSPPSAKELSSVSIDIDDRVAMETADNHSEVPIAAVVPNNQYLVHRAMDNMYVPSFPTMPTFAPLPPAPPVPFSLEGESELLAPHLSDDITRTVEPLDREDAEEQTGFGIVSEQAFISTPLPGGHAPLFYPQQELMGTMHPIQPSVLTGGHPVPTVGHPVPTGGHPPVLTGGHPVPTGGHPPVLTGGHPVPTGGHPPLPTGGHPVPTGGHPPVQTGGHPVQTGGHPLLQQESVMVERMNHPPQHTYHPVPQDLHYHQAPPIVQSTDLVLNRVIEGPIPNPPSYEQSHGLPSLQPVQPPIPPPISINPSNQFIQSIPSQVPPSHHMTEKDARIRELEERLASTERAAHEAQMEERRRQEVELNTLREQVGLDRARLEEVARRKTEEVELARKQLALEQERTKLVMDAQRQAMEDERKRMNMESRQLAAMKEQVERERAQMIEAGKQHEARAQLEQRRREEQRVFRLQGGLPPNWEKRLDSTTGRFYYVDHETKTTHWNPPTNWINYQRARQEELERRKQLQATPTPSAQPTPTPPAQPTPTPSAQPVPTPPTPPTGPAIDPSAKPEATPTQPSIPDRSKKPVAKQPTILLTPAMQKQKQQNLQAMFGTGRYVLTGLRNLGNTCYMNSTLQCLAGTSPVIKYFISGAYQEDINFSNPLGSRGQVASEFAWLMKALWAGSYKSVSPRDFKDMIGRFVPQMKGNDQQDSQEFLAFLLDGLHEDLNKVKKKVYIAEAEDGVDDNKAAELAWTNHVRRNNSIIVEHFQGMFRSRIQCTGCKKSSVTFEPFMYLSLPIPPGQGAYSLQDCVKLFIKSETVEWSCSNCKDPRGHAVKKMDIWRLPPVLLIHLKRFSYQGMWREKRQNTIHYPTESSLDMSSYVAGHKGHKSFTLYAVSNHFGTLSGGHYTACCRNPYNKVFYNFDDQEVKEALPRQLKSSAAYILYYSAVDLSPGRFTFS